MEISDAAIEQAERRMHERMEATPRATAARYDRRVSRMMVTLSNGLELAFSPHLAEGLSNAKPADLADIELTPSGLGLHWPKLDADLYLPALLQGVFGSPQWMVGLSTTTDGVGRSNAKVVAPGAGRDKCRKRHKLAAG